MPETWKSAVVSPILKKGSSTDKNNYRPVSCLIKASKVLEKVVCNQMTQLLEENKLLPKSQHGFRTKHSTMTAHSQMQKEMLRACKWLKQTLKNIVKHWHSNPNIILHFLIHKSVSLRDLNKIHTC